MEFLLVFKYLILYSLVVAISIALLLRKKPSRVIIIFTLITLLIPLSVWSYTSLDAVMGYSYNSYPPSNSVLISYNIKSSTEKIEVWVIQPNSISRLFSIPLTDELKKRLQELRKQQQGNKGTRIVFTSDEDLEYNSPRLWRLKRPSELLRPKHRNN